MMSKTVFDKQTKNKVYYFLFVLLKKKTVFYLSDTIFRIEFFSRIRPANIKANIVVYNSMELQIKSQFRIIFEKSFFLITKQTLLILRVLPSSKKKKLYFFLFFFLKIHFFNFIIFLFKNKLYLRVLSSNTKIH